MRGSTFAALVAPLAAVLVLACGTPGAPPQAADATEIDRALAQAERDLARAKTGIGT